MTKVYVLTADNDNGDREDFNPFHMTVEVFSTEEKRKARMEELEKANPQDEFCCICWEAEIDATENLQYFMENEDDE